MTMAYDKDKWEGVKPQRQTILETARDLTCGDRAKTHGRPYDNLHTFQKMWNAYEAAFDASPNATLPNAKEHKMAMFYVFSKIARIAQGNAKHEDHYVDTAAYIAIAYEALMEGQNESES